MMARARRRTARLKAIDSATEAGSTSPTTIVKVSENVFVGPPPSVPDIYWLAEEGFASLIGLRVAGERGQALPPETERRQAQAAGLSHCDVPVATAGEAEASQILARIIELFPEPAYVHCASVERAIELLRLAERHAARDGQRQGEIHTLIRLPTGGDEPRGES